MIDNSRLLGVVTLKSPGEVLPRWFSLFVNKSLVSNLFYAAFSIIGDWHKCTFSSYILTFFHFGP